MQRLVLYTPVPEEGRQLVGALRNQLSCAGNEELSCAVFTDAGGAAAEILANGTQLIGWDVSTASARQALLPARSACQEAFLLAVADEGTSPVLFLTPGIRPDALVFRPVELGEARRVANEMAADLLRRAADSNLIFTIHSRNGNQNIPYSSISYIEARGRKLYLRLDREEIGFVGTLEKLEQELPPNFCRTHRSFIVNADKIRQVQLTENLVLLWNGLAVPLSRSYKKNVKELHHG